MSVCVCVYVCVCVCVGDEEYLFADYWAVRQSSSVVLVQGFPDLLVLSLINTHNFVLV